MRCFRFRNEASGQYLLTAIRLTPEDLEEARLAKLPPHVAKSLRTSESQRAQYTHPVFIIGQFQEFPATFNLKKNLRELPRKGRYIAIVRSFGTRAEYRLELLRCQNCDDRLGRYTCDVQRAPMTPSPTVLRHAMPDVLEPGRQILMEMRQVRASPCSVSC